MERLAESQPRELSNRELAWFLVRWALLMSLTAVAFGFGCLYLMARLVAWDFNP